jgi:hypothetical protein
VWLVEEVDRDIVFFCSIGWMCVCKLFVWFKGWVVDFVVCLMVILMCFCDNIGSKARLLILWFV